MHVPNDKQYFLFRISVASFVFRWHNYFYATLHFLFANDEVHYMLKDKRALVAVDHALALFRGRTNCVMFNDHSLHAAEVAS